tara:strand:+ start:1291 stop:1962 length:672 start_codon:yes stop_codon:yes gene_type:complete
MAVNKKLAIFDLDHTILKCNSDHSWLDYLINKGFIKKEEYFEQNAEFQKKFREANVNYKEYYEFTIQYLRNKSDDYISNIRSDFMKEIIEPSINIYALRLIHKHYDKDDELLLASGTTSIIAGPIAKRLEFKNVVCTKCEQKNNIYTGKIEDPPSLGEGKLINVQTWMQNNGFSNFNGTTFYSDSILDMPLLEKVEKPVAVNPDKELLRVSQDLGWEIIDLPI